MHKVALRFYVFLWLLCMPGMPAVQASSIIDASEWRDLELVMSANGSHAGFTGKFDKLVTSFGKKQLELQIKNPTTDVQLLKQRQQALLFLLTNPVEQNELMEGFAQIEAHADGLVGLFSATESEKALQQEVNNMFYFQLNALKNLNANATALDARHVFGQAALFTPVLEYVVFHMALEFIRGKAAGGHHNCGHHHHDHGHHHDSTWLDTIINAIHLGHMALLPFSIKELVDQLSNKINLINLIYQKVAAASICVKSMQKINNLVQNNSVLLPVLGQANALSELFGKTQDAELKELIDLLRGDQFPPDNGLSFFSPVGITLKTYKLLQRNYARFSSALDMIGDLDALCAVASHVEKHQNTPAGYCFVEFIQADRPYLNAQKFWNPLLKSDTVITNDFCAGDQENPSKIIVTGPNKAGKTSIIKALALNLILAQTYGIAAAQKFVMTPFHKILTYIMVMDDIATDTSKFVASIVRADQCLQAISQLPDYEFVFTIIDDSLFEGTAQEKREAASCHFIKELGAFDNAMILAATHLPKLTMLEQSAPDIFKNYTITIATNIRGKKYSTFLLAPGICQPDEVFDIIEAQGYALHI